MTNREWLQTLTDEEFADWCINGPSFDFATNKPVQPSPKLLEIAHSYNSSFLGLQEWLKQERPKFTVVRVQQAFKDSDYFSTKYHYLVKGDFKIGDIVTDNEKTIGRIIQVIDDDHTENLKTLTIIPEYKIKETYEKIGFTKFDLYDINKKLTSDFLLSKDNKIISEKQLKVLDGYYDWELKKKTYEEISEIIKTRIMSYNDKYAYDYDEDEDFDDEFLYPTYNIPNM